MNRTETKTLESPLKLYSNLKFLEIGSIKMKAGATRQKHVIIAIILSVDLLFSEIVRLL